MNKDKKKSSLAISFGNLFGRRKLNAMEEEQIQGPIRTVIQKFFANRLAIVGLVVFLLFFLVAIVGPYFFPINLSYTEASQQNIAPGFNLMKYPSQLTNNVASIAAGATFSVGAGKDGKIYVWGHSKINKSTDISRVPHFDGKAIMVAAGYDHAIALTEEGEVVCWGNDRMQQLAIPSDISSYGKIIQVAAGYQISAALSEEGHVFVWGNETLNDAFVSLEHQGNIQKIGFTAEALIGLSKSGETLYLGTQSMAYSTIPEAAKQNIVDIAVSATSCAALSEDGTVTVWGNTIHGENKIPQTESKIKNLYAGKFHYTALTEENTLVAWGDNMFKQATIPEKYKTEKISDLYSGYFQNYAVTEDGRILTWGLKGYLLGTDGLGRDVLTRLINGGRMTMSIGAVAVIIATIIGIFVGSIAGYFGGKVDLLLMRLTEMVSSIPFLPFALILSSIIGNRIPEDQRILLIMVILGVLSWTELARLVRAQMLSQREQEFVVAAKAIGVRQNVIVFKHILPNVISTIIVNATLSFAACLLTESTLSYLGFGVMLPRPTWGNMLYGANNSVIIQTYWWQWVFPALALSICVICINLMGDGLRDAIDPKSNER